MKRERFKGDRVENNKRGKMPEVDQVTEETGVM